MNPRRFLSAWIILLPLAVTCQAQVAAPAAQPPAGKVLSEFKADDSIDGAVARLQKEDPDLKLLLVRDPGAPANQPHVNLALRNVAGRDVLMVVASVYPNIALREINGTTGPIFVLRIANPPQEGMRPQPATDEEVKVYNLTSLVDGWISHNSGPDAKVEDLPAMRKKALDQIMSLIQAALSQAYSTKPVLQVHEPTQTLVFKGTAEQRAIVQEAMQALQPPQNQGFGGGGGRGGVSFSSSAFANEFNNLQRRLVEQERELARVRKQIGDPAGTGASTQPTEPIRSAQPGRRRGGSVPQDSQP